jgi:hypothetical protein
MNNDDLTINEAATWSGLSAITVKRGLSIGKGNRTSFGRARMPGLKSRVTVVHVDGRPRMRTLIKLVDLKDWLSARSKLGSNGQLRGSTAKSPANLSRSVETRARIKAARAKSRAVGLSAAREKRRRPPRTNQSSC